MPYGQAVIAGTLIVLFLHSKTRILRGDPEGTGTDHPRPPLPGSIDLRLDVAPFHVSWCLSLQPTDNLGVILKFAYGPIKMGLDGALTLFENPGNFFNTELIEES